MSFWKPGTVAPGVSVERDEKAESGEAGDAIHMFNPNENLTIAKQRKMLPIYSHRMQLLYAIEKFQTTILVGQTGCGKTTRTLLQL